jgi:hypothetical protein
MRELSRLPGGAVRRLHPRAALPRGRGATLHHLPQPSRHLRHQRRHARHRAQGDLFRLPPARGLLRPTFELAAASEAVVRARVVVHAFSAEEFRKVTAEGTAVAAEVEKAALAKLGEYVYRRWGLAAASVVLLLFAGLVIIKARRLERERRSHAD